MRPSRGPAPAVLGRFGFPLGCALGVVATVLSGAAGATSQPILSLIAMVAAVDAVSMVTTVGAALATAAACWCLHTGFVLGRNGELAFTPQSRHDALVLLLAALSALAFASTIRAVRAQRDTDEYASNVPRIPTQRQHDSVVLGRPPT